MNVEVMEQLRLLKGLTVRFGCLHEAQVHQLKMYPGLIRGVEKSTALVNTNNRIVTFKCSGKKFIKTKKRLKELSMMTNWVRTLLWDDSVTVFEMNGKTVYDSTFDYQETESSGEYRELSE